MRLYITYALIFILVVAVVFTALWFFVPNDNQPEIATGRNGEVTATVQLIDECRVDADCTMIRGFPDPGSFYEEVSDCSTRCLTKTYAATKEAQDAAAICNPNLVYDPVQCVCEDKKCVEVYK